MADAAADRRGRRASPARWRFDCRTGRLRHVIRAKAVDPGDRRRAAASACPPRATCSAPTRTRPTPATATRWPTTRAPSCRGIECFQINPLIKDYNGPACAYVTGPFGGYTPTRKGERFIDCDYWSGPDDAGVLQRAARRQRPGVPEARPPGRGDDQHDRDHPAHQRAARAADASTQAAAHDYRSHDGRDAHLRDRPVQRPLAPRACGSTSTRATTVPGLYAAGDLACVPHNYMLGAFVYGELAGESAAAYCVGPRAAPVDASRRSSASARASARRCSATDGPAAAPGRVQAAPHGQRLPAAAEGHAQDGDRPASASRRSATTSTSCRRATRTS